ncbi:MAG: hypothetical protein ABIH34_02730 [Nanoarchaeota archaeon]
MEDKSLPFNIFIYVLATGIAVLIGTWGYAHFLAAKDQINTTQMPAINCIGLIYSIDGLSYDNGELTFTIESESYSTEDIGSLTVKTDKEKIMIEKQVPIGYTHTFSIPIERAANVSIYPTGCEIYQEVYPFP